jgi:hypothetical protein
MSADDDSRAGNAVQMRDPRRLTEESGVDPWLVDLVRSTGPYKSPPGRKHRVLLSLGRSNGPRQAPLVLRPAIVAGVLIGCGAFASAAIGPWRGWVGRAYERVASSSDLVAAAPAGARTHRLVAGQAVALAAPPAAVDRQSAESPPPDSALPSGAPVASRERAAPPHVRHAAPPSSVREGARHDPGKQDVAPARDREDQETQSVLAGMRALRVDHDPVRARGLLAKYLERHPNGALAEEALALTIEAAVAHHDDDAAVLGARYLRRYPAGPFRALALRAQH